MEGMDVIYVCEFSYHTYFIFSLGEVYSSLIGIICKYVRLLQLEGFFITSHHFRRANVKRGISEFCRQTSPGMIHVITNFTLENCKLL